MDRKATNRSSFPSSAGLAAASVARSAASGSGQRSASFSASAASSSAPPMGQQRPSVAAPAGLSLGQRRMSSGAPGRGDAPPSTISHPSAEVGQAGSSTGKKQQQPKNAGAAGNSTATTATSASSGVPVALPPSSTFFTQRQMEEIADVFALFNYHTHNGLMRGDDLGIALRVLGLEITRDQHRGYVALYSTSDTNLRIAAEAAATEQTVAARAAAATAAAAAAEQQTTANKFQRPRPGPPIGGQQSAAAPSTKHSPSGPSPPPPPPPAPLSAAQDLISKMANVKGSQNYFTLADFVEVCEDAKDARLRAAQQSGLGAASSATASARKGAFGARTADLFSVGGGGGSSSRDPSTASLGVARNTAGLASASSAATTTSVPTSERAVDTAHTRQWLSATFGTFGEASVTAEGFHKSLEQLFGSIQNHNTILSGAGGGRRRKSAAASGLGSTNDNDNGSSDGGGGGVSDDEGESGDLYVSGGGLGLRGLKQRQSTIAKKSVGGGGPSSLQQPPPIDGTSFVFEDDYLNPELNGVLSLEPPSLDEVKDAFRALGLDPHLGMTCEDLLGVLGTSTTIL